MWGHIKWSRGPDLAPGPWVWHPWSKQLWALIIMETLHVRTKGYIWEKSTQISIHIKTMLLHLITVSALTMMLIYNLNSHFIGAFPSASLRLHSLYHLSEAVFLDWWQDMMGFFIFWKFFLVRCEGLRTEGVVLSYWYSVQTVKSTETNVTFVILGCINKHWLIDDETQLCTNICLSKINTMLKEQLIGAKDFFVFQLTAML